MMTSLVKRVEPAGFTLIELLVVLAIVSTLLTLSLPRYFQYIESSRVDVLKENLHTVRSVIDKYYSDTGHYPDTLDELVERKYLHALPVDPVTGKTTTWVITAPEDLAMGRVFDIHSGAQGATRDGQAYGAL